jgi:NAD(P)H-flavin reductase
VFGPFPNPFYAPMGSRSNLIMIGAGTGMVPFRWLARKIQARRLDWMGKVLMLEGSETGIDELYLNRSLIDAGQYFDDTSRRAFEALKTRYSAVASDMAPDPAELRDALWRLMGQGSVYVYLAGYSDIAEALDQAMDAHLRLPGRWAEAKEALKRDGHWLEHLYE